MNKMRSRSDLISILEAFLDTITVLNCQAFGNGHIHETYLVETAGQCFILQQINQKVFKNVAALMQNMVQVSKHLRADKQYPLSVLMPYRSHSGANYLQDTQGNYWRLFPFIENTISLSKIESSEQAYAIAQAFGAFIAALDNFPSTQLAITIPNFHNGLYRLQQLEQAIQKAKPSRLQAARPILNLLQYETQVFKQVARLKLPLRVVHNDTKADNILLDKSTLSARCVIDLDTLMPGTLLSDFGDMVRTCSNSELEDSDAVGAVEMRRPIYDALQTGFLDALQEVIQPEERNALLLGAEWIILEQTTRFLTDFLEGDMYYKTKYPTHNLVRAKNQFALYQSLKRQCG